MAIAFVNSSSNQAAATSVAVTTAGGAVPDGYVMVAMANTGGAGSANITPPAGWTIHDQRTLAPNNMRVGLFTKLAASEGLTQTFNCADSTNLEAFIMWFSGVDATTPLDNVTPVVATGTDATIEFADLTTLTDNAMNALLAVEAAFYPTMPASYTSGGHSANTISGAYKLKTPAGLISGLTGVSFSNWCAYGVSLRESGAAAGPAITSVSTATPREGASLTITGTLFGASQGAGNSTINGVSQTETSWGDTSVVATVVLGTNKFGAPYNVALTDNAGTPSNNYAGITGLLPANSGRSYVDVGTPNPTAAYRLTSSADLVSGDQIEYDNVGGLVTVYDDGTFAAGPGVSSFSFRVWTSGSGYGPSASQVTSLSDSSSRPFIRPFNKRVSTGF